jgi:broad specificity phosphatase PhoE
MKKKSYIIGTGILIAFFLCCFFFWYNRTTIYIVRHADKNTSIINDPPLSSPAGEQRAIDLANHLRFKKIGFIYSTDSLRAKSTARPLANIRGLQISIYLKDITPVSYSSLPRHDSKNILIVGHSETILRIFRDLRGSTSLTSISGNDYDNLLIVTINRFLWFKWTNSVVTTYGSSSP